MGILHVMTTVLCLSGSLLRINSEQIFPEYWQYLSANQLPFSLFTDDVYSGEIIQGDACRQFDFNIEECKKHTWCHYSCSEDLCISRYEFSVFPSEAECQVKVNHLSCADYCGKGACQCAVDSNSYTHCTFDEYANRCVSLRQNVSEYVFGREVLKKNGIKNFQPCIRGSLDYPVFYAFAGVTFGSWKTKNIDSCTIAEVIYAVNFGSDPELGNVDTTDSRGIKYTNSKNLPCGEGGNYACDQVKHDDLITYGVFQPVTTQTGLYYDKIPGIRESEQALYGSYMERKYDNNLLETVLRDPLLCINFPMPLSGKVGAFEICVLFADWILENDRIVKYRFYDIWFGNYIIARTMSIQRLFYEDYYGSAELCFPVYLFRKSDGSSLIYVSGYVRGDDEWAEYNEAEYTLSLCSCECTWDDFGDKHSNVVRGWKVSAISVVRYDTGNAFEHYV